MLEKFCFGSARNPKFRHPKRVVWMDCQMPGMDGYETTALIRQGEKGTLRRIPVVAMTANALPGDREKCLAAGMDDYITKPVQVDVLARALARWDAPLDSAVLAKLSEAGPAKMVGELVRVFLSDVPKRLKKLRLAAADRNAKELAAEAHALKGASGNVGAQAMYALCARLENLGLSVRPTAPSAWWRSWRKSSGARAEP
jgi:two-component system, sensor histidine kinase and response regulator